MKYIFTSLCLSLIALPQSHADTVWFDDFESYAAGAPPTNQNQWFLSGGAGSAVLVSTNLSYNWRSSEQLSTTTNAVLLISTGAAHASMWRICSNAVPNLESITWSVLTTNANVDAMYLQVRDASNHLFCGVGLAANGQFQFKAPNGTWSSTGIAYATNVWHRLILTLNYANATFSFYEKNQPVAVDQPFATNQTTTFIPANVYVQGPVNNAGSCYVDSIKAEFLQAGTGLQALINNGASAGRCDLASNITYDVATPLMLPSNFTLNGNGSTLRMTPYSQHVLLANSNWLGDHNITVCYLVLDGNAYDQSINPSNNATTRYLASNVNNLDNQGAYFKKVDTLLVTNVTFTEIPNEALMLVSDGTATVANCRLSNCALLTVSNNMSQAAVYTRWTTNSQLINNQFYGCYEGGIANGTGSDHNYLAGNYTTNSAGGEGIFLGQSSYCLAIGNTILNSSYLGDPLNYPPSNAKYWGSGAGIACDGIGQASTQVSNTICYNYIWSIGSAGITSASALGTQIFGNQIYVANCVNQAAPSGAISLITTTNVSVYDNVIQSNNCPAIGVVASKNCVLTNNLLCPDNNLNGVTLSSSVNITTNYNFYESASTNVNLDPAIILDNTNSSGVAIVGTWVFSTSTAGYYGNGYLHDNNTGGTGGKSVRFTPNFPTGGTYAVFLDWTSAPNRATNAPIDVVFSGHTNTYLLNQQSNGGQWNWLGNFNFTNGGSNGVVVRNDGASGYVIADAVKFALLVPQPDRPGQLSADAGNGLVEIIWSAVPTAISYNIKRSLNSGGPFAIIGTAQNNSFTDTSVVNGTTYYYAVSAVNSGGESANTGAVSAMPSCGSYVPNGLVPVASPGNNQVSMQWNQPSAAAASQIAYYQVKRSATNSGPFTVLAQTTNAVYVDSNLTAGSVYYYTVSAVNPCGSEGSNSIVVTAMPGIIIDNSDNAHVIVTGAWTANTSADAFGLNYLHDGNASTGKAVRFTPSLPVTGAYDVYAWWVANANRATNTPVDIIYVGGTNTLFADQTKNGAQWNYIGSFTFNAGTNGSVRIRDDGASGYVIADAVQWVWNTNTAPLNVGSGTQLTNPAPSDQGLSLNATSTGTVLNLSWPSAATGYVLQSASSLIAPVNWVTLMAITNGENSTLLPMTNAMMFYRLRSP